MIDLGALIRVPCVELEMGFAISPDGLRLAYSWNPDGHWEIFEISIRLNPDLSDPPSSGPKQISRGPGANLIHVIPRMGINWLLSSISMAVKISTSFCMILLHPNKPT